MSYKNIPFYPHTYKIINQHFNLKVNIIMMNKEDEKIIEQFAKTRNIKYETERNYKIYLQEYCTQQSKTLTKLLQEAETEEEEGIRWKNRTLKKRLTEHRSYLYNKHAPSTAKARMTKIMTFYRHHDIEIHQLPPFNVRNLDNTAPINYTDLPDKEIIRAAVDVASPVMKPLILFMSSSGCGRAETLNLTVHSYIKATENYHQGGSIQNIIETLNKNKDVVPTFNIKRVKTNKYYTTFCSPETVTAINTYLLSRNNLTLESRLFKINKDYFIEAFENINNKLDLGKVGHYNRFRSHMLRKYHATTLYNDGMSLDTVNDLQGKTKNRTDNAYFMINIEDLRNEYIKHLPALMIGKEIEKITVKSKEFVELESENNSLKQEINNLKGDVADIKKMFDI